MKIGEATEYTINEKCDIENSTRERVQLGLYGKSSQI